MFFVRNEVQRMGEVEVDGCGRKTVGGILDVGSGPASSSRTLE